MSDTTDIFAKGDAAECATNFLTGIKEIGDSIYLFMGIFNVIPLLVYYSDWWNNYIDSQLAVIDA